MDEPEMLGGEGEGPNPMEYVMAALNGCITVMVSTIANEMGIKVNSLDVESSGKIDVARLDGNARNKATLSKHKTDSSY